MSTPKIEPCPWCGSEAVDGTYGFVHCARFVCGARGQSSESQRTRIRAWNRVARLAKAGKAKRAETGWMWEAKKGRTKR